MINLKVKTLDSQNHEFTVQDDITVRQFKDHISEETCVSPEFQRLIYCGRVLMDEKLLKDYDVNGKVVHLVQRAPPGSRNTNQGGPGAASENNAANHRIRDSDGREGNLRGAPIFRALDGMVVGAMSIPMTSNNGTPQAAAPSLNPSSSLCMNRITVARHMLECANNIVNFLDDPNRGLNNAAMDILAQQTMESTVFEVGISPVGEVDLPQHQVQDFVNAFQGALSAVLRQNGVSNITVMQQPGIEMPSFQVIGTHSTRGTLGATNLATPTTTATSVSSNNTATEASTSTTTTTPIAPSTDEATAEASSSPNATTGNSSSNQNGATASGRSRQQTTSTQTLAEVIQQMRVVQGRLEPYLTQYYNILLNDPVYEASNLSTRENDQRIYDRVSEALHYFSHAQHAISDLMLDLSTTVPRHLCCRPILVEQSAFVSSLIPNMNIGSVLRPNGSNNEVPTAQNVVIVTTDNQATNAQQSQDRPPQAQPPTQAQQQQQQQQGQFRPIPIPVNNNSGGSRMHLFIPVQRPPLLNTNRLPALTQMQVASIIQAVMDTDVHVRMNAPNATASSNNNNNNTDDPNITVGLNNGTTNQARVTTATHPTTSTQTRSTARPQVHVTGLPPNSMRNIRPVPVSNMLSAFDRFLTCNSHHIRDNPENESRPRNVPRIFRNVPRPVERNSNQRVPVFQRNIPTTQQSSVVTFECTTGAIHIFGCEITFLELMEINAPNVHTLNRVRQELRTFVTNLFCNNQPSMDEIIDRALRYMEHVISALTRFEKNEYDSRASFEAVFRNCFPSIVNLIRDDDTVQFGERFIAAVSRFFKSTFIIILHCLGRTNATLFFDEIIRFLISATDIPRGVYGEVYRHYLGAINSELDKLYSQNGQNEVTQFMVKRRPTSNASATTSRRIPSTPMDTDDNAEGTPETEGEFANDEIVTITVETLIQPPPPPPLDRDDSLPDVLVGTESWHDNFPPAWIPVITRDVSRQRRQNTQPAFSDAYLSGMSSKRRKMINNAKPSTDIPTLLTDGVRTSIKESGINASNSSVNVEEVTAAIVNDPAVQSSYREAVNTNIQERLKTDKDFNSTKFPNTSKFFNCKK